ncbi:MAG: hypothetical protein HC814_06385 [Rhodobacteraceae bacterium]|nr:hypothetical protein [Paracoccaceae bacterium]
MLDQPQHQHQKDDQHPSDGHHDFHGGGQNASGERQGYAEQEERYFGADIDDVQQHQAGGALAVTDAVALVDEHGLHGLAADGRQRRDMIDRFTGDVDRPQPAKPAHIRPRRAQRQTPVDGVDQEPDATDAQDHGQAKPAEPRYIQPNLREIGPVENEGKDAETERGQRHGKDARAGSRFHGAFTDVAARDSLAGIKWDGWRGRLIKLFPAFQTDWRALRLKVSSFRHLSTLQASNPWPPVSRARRVPVRIPEPFPPFQRNRLSSHQVQNNGSHHAPDGIHRLSDVLSCFGLWGKH